MKTNQGADRSVQSFEVDVEADGIVSKSEMRIKTLVGSFEHIFKDFLKIFSKILSQPNMNHLPGFFFI